MPPPSQQTHTATIEAESPTPFPARADNWRNAQAQDLDVLVVGGGVSGAAVFRELADAGKRVLLVDRGDFCCRTSQASGLLIWGGLLYLRNLDFREVHRLCLERDRLLAEHGDLVKTMDFRYLPLRGSLRQRWVVNLVLKAYWLIGGRRRAWPGGDPHFESESLLVANRFKRSLRYEEAALVHSDSQFVTGWITSRMGGGQTALNHCSLTAARWDTGAKLWILELEDQQTGETSVLRSKLLVNAGGVWADRLNDLCGLKSPYRHVLSKGVYMNLPRPASLKETLVFETGEHGDSITMTPWGPVALWGPTEDIVANIEEGFAPNREDLRFLLDQGRRNLHRAPQAQDAISLRCGIRPLAVKSSYHRERYPLTISRKHLIVTDTKKPAITIYGGKITSAPMLAREVLTSLEAYDLPQRSAKPVAEPITPPPTRIFGALQEPQADPLWCRDMQACVTLEDYLRRRSNIAQWVPRMGLGHGNAHVQEVTQLAHLFHGPHGAQAAVNSLQQQADRQDALLASV